MLTRKMLPFAPTGLLSLLIILLVVFLTTGSGIAAKSLGDDQLPKLDKSVYHTWEEVNAYLDAIARHDELDDIVKLIPIGYTREGRPLRVLQISNKEIPGQPPHKKPAAFIMGAHHAREHVSKEVVLALIDRIIHKYDKEDMEGQAITYLVDAGTFYLLPWVNPDGGTNEYFHNPEQRKTNYPSDEPQIGFADCDTCGDGLIDEDSPDIATGDVGITSATNRTVAFANNGIISRTLQLWYDADLPPVQRYILPVVDARVGRVQPMDSAYTFNYEGLDPDADGEFGPYSGEDFVGGTDPNRNYGGPVWGDCAGNQGCSWLSGAQTYAGPRPFSEPETAAVAAFLRSHPNIGTLESLHSGINEIYPPWFIYPDQPGNATMDQAYTDVVGQYISRTTGYEVVYGGPYSVKGDTTGYSYAGSSQDPALSLDFYAGGVLSFTTEVYGMGSTSGSAEAVRDWFPNHYQQFDTGFAQGVFIAWTDFPWCTTCDPAVMPGPRSIFDYLQYKEFLRFFSTGTCGGADTPGIFNCDYWGIGGSPSYYADMDIFAYFNPPSANRHYATWNSDGAPLVRTVDLNIKHLLYRVYISPFLRVDEAGISGDEYNLTLSVENTGLLRSSIMTAARLGQDPLTARYYDHGNVEVQIKRARGFSVIGAAATNIGWLGGGVATDPAPRSKTASFKVDDLDEGDSFLVKAGSEKTGWVKAMVEVYEGKKDDSLRFKVVWTNRVERPAAVEGYFHGNQMRAMRSMERSATQIQSEMVSAEKERQNYRRIEGPFELVPGKSQGIVVKKYH